MIQSDTAGNTPYVFIGAGGHARLVLSCMDRESQERVVGVSSRSENLAPPFDGLHRFFSDEELVKNGTSQPTLINGVGANPHVTVRREIFKYFKRFRFCFEAVISATATIDQAVKIGEGSQILPSATVNVGTELFENVVVYTGCIIEHDCSIGAHSHISPGAILLGHVSIGESTFVGAGAIVYPGVKVGANSIIGAGQRITSDLASGSFIK